MQFFFNKFVNRHLLTISYRKSRSNREQALPERKLLKGFVLSEKNTMDRTRRREKKRWTEEGKRKGGKKKEI